MEKKKRCSGKVMRDNRFFSVNETQSRGIYSSDISRKCSTIDVDSLKFQEFRSMLCVDL